MSVLKYENNKNTSIIGCAVIDNYNSSNCVHFGARMNVLSHSIGVFIESGKKQKIQPLIEKRLITRANKLKNRQTSGVLMFLHSGN